MVNKGFTIRSVSPRDRTWVQKKTREEWGDEFVVVHGELFYPADLPGFVVESAGEGIGLLTYHLNQQECEVITLNSWLPGQGVGSSLLDEVRSVARKAGSRRLFLVTTNNNWYALRFYQKRGFHICAVRINALESSRKLKPGIPPVDESGIPIRDEIELECFLAN